MEKPPPPFWCNSPCRENQKETSLLSKKTPELAVPAMALGCFAWF